MSQGPRLVMLGEQGAGKGTQAARLAEHYRIVHLSTGDLCRAAANAGTRFGLQAKDYMDRGELVPDDVTVGLVEERFSADGSPLRGGFVLDGFPRNRNQAVELDRVLDGLPLDLAIDLDVPRDVVLARLAGRRVCSRCGAVYHVDMPPSRPWVCDVCGDEVVQRDDDTEEAISRRLELYEEETVPLLDYYRARWKLAVVDGVGSGDDVFERLVKVIDDWRASPPGPPSQ